MILANAIIYFTLFGIWTKKNVLNFAVKTAFLGMAVWNLIEYMK